MLALSAWAGGCSAAQAFRNNEQSVIPSMGGGTMLEQADDTIFYRTDKAISEIEDQLRDYPAIVFAVDGPDVGVHHIEEA